MTFYLKRKVFLSWINLIRHKMNLFSYDLSTLMRHPTLKFNFENKNYDHFFFCVIKLNCFFNQHIITYGMKVV